MNLSELPGNDIWGAYDWEEVLGQPAEYAQKGGAADPVYSDQIAEVIWLWAESPEGYGSVDAAIVMRLNNGTYAMCEAWADTTGWGCQDGVTWKIAPSVLLAASELSPANRERLTVDLLGEGT